MMVCFREFKTLWLFVFEKLWRDMLSGHVGIVYVMGLDKGLAYAPNSRLVIDCVDSRDRRRVCWKRLRIREIVRRSGEDEMGPIAVALTCLVD